MGKPLTSNWVMLSSDLLRGWVPRRMAPDFSGFKARPLWKNQEVRCTIAVSRRFTWSEELLLDEWMKTWVSSAYWCWSTLNWLVTNWTGEMREVNRIQIPNLGEYLFWARLWRRHPDRISRIGPSGTGRTPATLKHCHRHTLSDVELAKLSDQWCRRQHWGWVTRKAWIPSIGL